MWSQGRTGEANYTMQQRGRLLRLMESILSARGPNTEPSGEPAPTAASTPQQPTRSVRPTARLPCSLG